MGDYGIRFNNAVAAELRAQRGREKTSFDRLRELTGFSKTALLHWLNGQREIPMPAFIEIAAALNAEPGAIFDAAAKAVADEK